MLHRFAYTLTCCLLLPVALTGCDDGAASVTADDPLSDIQAEDYTPPPEPGPEARAALERGKALLARGDLEAAIEQFGQAVTMESRFAEAYLYRAKARDRQSAAALAMIDVDNAILHDRRLAEAYRLRAELYERRYFMHNDPADKKRVDDDLKRYEELRRQETAAQLSDEVDDAVRKALDGNH